MSDNQAGAFKRPDISKFVPQGMEDVVARVSAAGQRIMYSDQMRDELRAEVQRDAPVAQKMAESVVGLLLTIDKQTQGGIPEGALFPAGLDLLGEAAEVLTKAGQQVTQEDYNEAARMMFVLMAKKLGIKDDQIMGAAAQAAGAQGGGAPDDEASEPTPDDEAAEGEQGGQPPEEAGEQPGQPDEEEQAMQEGFQR